MSVPAGKRQAVPLPEPSGPASEVPVPTQPDQPAGPGVRYGTYLALVVIGIEMGMLGAFLSVAGLHVAHLTVPIGPPLAVVTNVAAGLWAARLTGSRGAVAAPALGWLGSVLFLSMSRAEGDVVVTNTGRGVAFLVLGALAWVVAAAASRWVVPAAGSTPEVTRPGDRFTADQLPELPDQLR